MGIRQYLNLTVGSLMILNVLLAFGAIGLLVRMGPAIEKILQENVYSIMAAEEILTGVAIIEDSTLSSERLTQVENALNRAKVNVTEKDEIPILEAIEKNIKSIIGGDLSARKNLIDNLQSLIEINRNAMRRVDKEAKRLSAAGAWAAAFIGFISFLASVFIIRRFRKTIIEPVLELYNVLEAQRKGELFRRCTSVQAAPEIQSIHYEINMLLDQRIPDHPKLIVTEGEK